jgi:hypothetical protein
MSIDETRDEWASQGELAKVALIDDCPMDSRLAARVTLRSFISTPNATSRFRSTRLRLGST